DVELLFLSRKKKYRIDEIPVRWEEAETTTLSFWSPLQMLRDLFRIRWFELRGFYRSKGKKDRTRE
ncbi:MAG: hypothetical protein AAF517_00185, partial [Planctomycetota bacterium]